jgi:putative transposase
MDGRIRPPFGIHNPYRHIQECGGYHEIAQPPQRYTRIDRKLLAQLLGLSSADDLPDWQQEAIDKALSEERTRHPEWTESIAVGSREFIENVQKELGLKVLARKSDELATLVLREPPVSYRFDIEAKNDVLRANNTLFLDVTY